MNKISKILILSVLVLAMASVASATTSRVIALANAAPYMNDDSDIFRWYGTISSYNDMVMAELGQASGGFSGDVTADWQALGFTKSMGKDNRFGILGVFLLFDSLDDMSFFANSMFLNAVGENNPIGTLTFEGTNVMPTTKFVFSWGNEIEDVLSYGFMFTRSDASIETTADGTNDINFLTLGGGIRGDIGDKTYYDVALTYGTAGGDTLGGFDKGTAFDLGARAFYEYRDDLTLVPYFDWNTFEYAYTDIAATTGIKVSDVTLGLSLNWNVNSNNLLLFATELEWLNIKPSKVAAGDLEETKITVLPKFYMALETDITSWLTTRVGAAKWMQKVEDIETNGDITTETGPSFPGGDFEWSLGLGFHVGEWDLDAVLSHEAPFRVGYWITGFGVNDPDPFVGRVSGTYRF